MKIKKHLKSAWITRSSSERLRQKPWGTEQNWAGFHGIHGKTLFIRKGERTSLKYYPKKTEILFVRSGSVEVTFGNECSIEDPVANPMMHQAMSEGDTLMVQSCCPYRISATTDSEIIEIGDSMSDQPVRLEDDYGRSVNDKGVEKNDGD
jgi:mannose-6-phosphate isomerase-like protein (cupin superfamily)